MLNFVNDYISKNKLKNVIQIGGNDGQQDDFVRKLIDTHDLSAYILEPIEEYFLELSKSYSDNKKVQTFNFAITETDGVQEINFIKCDLDSPLWLKGCSSFYEDRNVLSGWGGTGMKTKMPSALMSKVTSICGTPRWKQDNEFGRHHFHVEDFQARRL